MRVLAISEAGVVRPANGGRVWSSVAIMLCTNRGSHSMGWRSGEVFLSSSEMTRKCQQNNLESYDLLTSIQKEHRSERNLCDMLERIADNLPEPLDADLARTGIFTLRRCLKRHVTLEEEYLYPVLTKRLCPGDLGENMLDHIRREHAADESLAHDTADQLELALERGRVENPEMLGYMLRGFFECRRRHIAWEDAIVLPLARLRLSAKDFSTFSVEKFEESIAMKSSVEITRSRF